MSQWLKNGGDMFGDVHTARNTRDQCPLSRRSQLQRCFASPAEQVHADPVPAHVLGTITSTAQAGLLFHANRRNAEGQPSVDRRGASSLLGPTDSRNQRVASQLDGATRGRAKRVNYRLEGQRM
jgi:hypothetical protein